MHKHIQPEHHVLRKNRTPRAKNKKHKTNRTNEEILVICWFGIKYCACFDDIGFATYRKHSLYLVVCAFKLFPIHFSLMHSSKLFSGKLVCVSFFPRRFVASLLKQFFSFRVCPKYLKTCVSFLAHSLSLSELDISILEVWMPDRSL